MALSRSHITDAASREKTLHERINQTFRRRGEGKKEYEAWSRACEEWRSHSSPLDVFWSDGFIKKLRKGDREAVEASILFLEVDPFYHRSGYLKEKLIRCLRAEILTERDKVRLRSVVWNVARGANRREFSNFCTLASRVSTPEFELQIESGIEQYDDECGGKLSKLLQRLRRNQ